MIRHWRIAGHRSSALPKGPPAGSLQSPRAFCRAVILKGLPFDEAPSVTSLFTQHRGAVRESRTAPLCCKHRHLIRSTNRRRTAFIKRGAPLGCFGVFGDLFEISAVCRIRQPLPFRSFCRRAAHRPRSDFSRPPVRGSAEEVIEEVVRVNISAALAVVLLGLALALRLLFRRGRAPGQLQGDGLPWR